MYTTAVLAIWFSSSIAGVVITMLIPHIFTEATGSWRRSDQLMPESSEEAFQRTRASQPWIERAA
jgi:hypothetical protein